MGPGPGDTPRFVDAALAWRWTRLLAPLALVSAYGLGAAVKLADSPAAVAEQRHFHRRPRPSGRR